MSMELGNKSDLAIVKSSTLSDLEHTSNKEINSLVSPVLGFLKAPHKN